MSNESTGFSSYMAWLPNSNTWLTGAAAVAGAGHQIEFYDESFDADSQLIENMGLNGQAVQLPGAKGDEFHKGGIKHPLYFRGLERMIAQVMGSSPTPTQQGADNAWKHVIAQADSVIGTYGTLVLVENLCVREYAHVKLTGFEMEFQKGKEASIAFQGIPADLHLNTGSPIANRIVASVEPANGARTIANQPTTPSPITVLITDANTSITEYLLTIVGTNRDNDYISETYQLSVDGLAWTSTNYFKTVVSVTGSGLAGTATGDTLVVGVSNGKNNATTVASITLPSTTERDLVLFQQCELLVGDMASGSAMTAAANEFFVEKFKLKVDRKQEGSVTTRGGNKVDEPIGTGFLDITLGFDFPDWNSQNHSIYTDYLYGKPKKKVSWIANGPLVHGTTFARLACLFNNVQFSKAPHNINGPGRSPMAVEGKAHRALAAPTGSDWAYTRALTIELTNGNDASALHATDS